LVPLETVKVKNHKEIIDKHKKFIEYSEGTVIRQGSAPYLVGRRSKYALKLKDFQDEEFEIVDFTDGKGKEKGFNHICSQNAYGGKNSLRLQICPIQSGGLCSRRAKVS
jgi:ATP-dependent DNA ligase